MARPARFSLDEKKTRDLRMEGAMFLKVAIMILMTGSAAYGATKPPPPSPAPAPAPFAVNLTDLLTVTGPYHQFLSYLESTKVIETLQHQANDSHQGVTIFVPTDDAFSSLKKPSLSNLTQDQLKNLLLFHSLPKFYSLADFRNLSKLSPVATFAGGPFALNFTDDSGTIHVYSGWTTTKIGSAVLSTYPVAVYQVGGVLLPEAIFGAAPPPAPAPAPAPDTNVSDISPSSSVSSTSGSPNSSPATASPSAAPTSRLVGGGVLLSSLLVISGITALL
ncbi:Fasciclin-like arabinogalactan protein 7 [Nymphaea thermarum]|nr:Fasciclin-like arabinogalactan protein 7 [Nymphaea thermarum]